MLDDLGLLTPRPLAPRRRRAAANEPRGATDNKVISACLGTENRRLRDPARGRPLRHLVPRVRACAGRLEVRRHDGARPRPHQPQPPPAHRPDRLDPRPDHPVRLLGADLRLGQAHPGGPSQHAQPAAGQPGGVRGGPALELPPRRDRSRPPRGGPRRGSHGDGPAPRRAAGQPVRGRDDGARRPTSCSSS